MGSQQLPANISPCWSSGSLLLLLGLLLRLRIITALALQKHSPCFPLFNFLMRFALLQAAQPCTGHVTLLLNALIWGEPMMETVPQDLVFAVSFLQQLVVALFPLTPHTSEIRATQVHTHLPPPQTLASTMSQRCRMTSVS